MTEDLKKNKFKHSQNHFTNINFIKANNQND